MDKSSIRLCWANLRAIAQSDFPFCANFMQQLYPCSGEFSARKKKEHEKIL